MDAKMPNSKRRCCNSYRLCDSRETKHFDFVCEGVAQGIKDLNVQTDIPVIFCVLTDNTMQQSIDRSGGIHGNKGTEAAIAAIKMAFIRQQASLTHQKEIKFIAHWSFADRKDCL
jgi:hypothetical protein